jgi:1,4-dihydroxy-2-naphthoate octaprenyltransferase
VERVSQLLGNINNKENIWSLLKKEGEHMEYQKFKNIMKVTRASLALIAMIMYISGVLFAVAVGGHFDLYRVLLGFLIVFTSVYATGSTNNYYDASMDKNATQTGFSGGSDILSKHPELRPTVRRIIIVLYSTSIVLGLVFTVLFSFPAYFFAFVLVSNFIGWSYTAPPLRLVYHGLGEVLTMFGIGFSVVGAGYWVTKGTIDLTFVWFSLPLLLFGFGVNFYLEIPDRYADILGQKKTIVVRRDERFGFIVGAVSLAIATLCYTLFSFYGVFSGEASYVPLVVFSLLPLTIGIWALWKYLVDKAKMMQVVFRATASIVVAWILTDVYLAYVILT